MVMYNKIKAMKWFTKRTAMHISLVKKYAGAIIATNEFKGVGLLGIGHDDTKYQKQEYSIQVYLSYKYKMTRDAGKPIEFKVDGMSQEELNKKVDTATLYHVTNNKHHPEYWTTTSLEEHTREKPVNNIVAYKMPDKYILEMVCDWCAISEELKTDPNKWADDNIGKRWLFTDHQKELIYKALELIWK